MEWKLIRLWLPLPTVRLVVVSAFLGASLAAVATAAFGPPMHSASYVLSLPAAPRSADAEMMTTTHVALLRSQFVIESALRDADVQQLAVLRLKPDAASWIKSNLHVSVSDRGRVDAVKITLASNEGSERELQIVVDSLVKAYRMVLAESMPSS